VSRTTQILLAVGVTAAALAAYWYLALAPRRQEVAKLDTEVATKQAAVQTAQATANNYETTRKAYRKNYATVVRPASERAEPDRRRDRSESRHRRGRHHRSRHDAGERQHPANDDRRRWSDRMKLLTDAWRQLVQRRLWPVALLLLGALVAVPFVLGKSPEPVAPAPAPAAGNVNASAASADPIVSMASAEDSSSTRRSLGACHNPFVSSAPKPPPR
jgi:hypothetical protein